MKHMSHCHATVLLGHDGFIFLINLAKYIVNLMVVHLLIYLTPVIPVNTQVLRCMLKSEWYFKSPKMTTHFSPLSGLPLLLERPVSRKCLSGSFSICLPPLSFHFSHIICLQLLSCHSFSSWVFANAIPSLESSCHLLSFRSQFKNC